MNMRDEKIKELFVKADEQIHIDEMRKHETYSAVLEETEKPRREPIPVKNILLQQFYYVDKIFFAAYGVVICLGMIFILVLQHMGVGQRDMLAICMTCAGILSLASIGIIDRLFFGKMAELGASCYFSTKQCVAAGLVLSGGINVMVLFLLTGCLNYRWRIGMMQTGLYIVTPYLLSCVAALGILSLEIKEKSPAMFAVTAILLSIAYVIVAEIPNAFTETAICLWGGAFVLAVVLFVFQVKRLFGKIERGEVLCMN